MSMGTDLNTDGNKYEPSLTIENLVIFLGSEKVNIENWQKPF